MTTKSTNVHFSRKTGYSANLKKISLYCLTRVHNRYNNVHKMPQGKHSQKMGLWKYKAWWLSHVTCSHLFSSTACWAQDFFFLLSPPKVISVQILSTSLLLSLFLSLYPTQRSIPVDYMMTTSTYDLLEEATF